MALHLLMRFFASTDETDQEHELLVSSAFGLTGEIIPRSATHSRSFRSRECGFVAAWGVGRLTSPLGLG